MTPPYLPARELRDIAGKTSAPLLPLETAVMLPVPIRTNGALEALVVYYDETGPRTHRTVHPPHHAMRLDPTTGKVLHFGATTPERLGIRRPITPVPGVGIDPKMTVPEFITKRDRFLEISADVWSSFAAGSTSVDAATATLVAEYWDLFAHITKAEVAPFYTGAARDFFDWVRAASGVP